MWAISAINPSPVRGSHILADSQPIPRCSFLLYAGGLGRRHYSVSDLVDMVAVVDTADHPVGWLCPGILLTEIRATSGRYYYPFPGVSAKGQDWNAYLDSLFTARGALPSLDSAVALVAAQHGPAPGGFRVTLMIPYPARASDTVWIGHRPFLPMGEEQRRALAAAYVDEVERRFSDAHLSHLTLFAYYWLNEDIRPDDSLLVQQTAAVVHQRGRRFVWIPYFHSAGNLQWRRWGFDYAWLQPNYFFHPEVPVTRFDSALTYARTADMGIELEFDPRIFSDWRFMDRLEPYLSAVENATDIRAKPITVYEGGGALIRLARSADPWHRALYTRLVAVLRSP